jgi:HAD superfamily hydrolase (TIGR01509 family)
MAGIVRPMRTDTPPAAIVFDLDGTLVDTVAARIEAWSDTFAQERIAATREQLAPMIGMDGVRLAHEVAAAAGRQLSGDEALEIDHRAGRRFDELNRDPTPLPGTREALSMLDRRGVTWAIGTSSRPAQVAASLRALDLGHEPRVIDGSAVEHAKPAPDLLLLAAKELGVAPADTWYVGDSTWDMQAAAAAGMLPIAVLAGAAVDAETLRAAGATVVWPTLEELAALAWS